MPQEIHVVQCYSCEMYQVDIVKKVPKWTCKLCGKKQSLKRVFCVGSGKDCRLQVQKLNELQGSKEQNLFSENVSPNISHSSDASPQEATNTTATTNWSWPDFDELNDEDIDAIYDEDFSGATTEDMMIQGTSSKEENHRQCSERSDDSSISTYEDIGAKRIHENDTNCSSHLEGPVAKMQKIETNNSEWNQFLSDESN